MAMVVRFNLKFLLALTTVAAIVCAMFHWCGVLFTLFLAIILLIWLSWCMPIKSFATYWLWAAAFICYVIYEAIVPAGMNIRVDLLFIYPMALFSLPLQLAKYGDDALRRRREAKTPNSSRR
jgi:hypothetical protein